MIKFFKFLLRCLLKLLYRVEVNGLEHYQAAGDRVLIVANHTSLLDGILLYAWLPDTPTFAINTRIADRKSFKLFLKFVDLFVMDPTNPLSVKSMVKFLSQNKKAVIFPEGRITTTGSLMKIYAGPGLIADKSGATVLPIAIDGAIFSPFSYLQKQECIVWFPQITLTILPPEKFDIDENIHGHDRRKHAATMMQDIMYLLTYSSFNHRTTIFAAMLSAANRYGKNTLIAEDINREPVSYKQLITKAMIVGGIIRQETEANEHLGIMMPNVIGTLVTFLAIQYSTRVPAMINFTSGTQAVIRACNTGKIKTIYTSRKFIQKANLEELATALEDEVRLVYLEDLSKRISVFNKLAGLIRSFYPQAHYRRLAKNISPDDPAVILFTSGSEGSPKGVVLSHSNALSNYAQVSCHIDFRPQDLIFSCLPLFHTFGLNAGFLMPLFGGSKVFLYPTPLHYRIIPELVYELEATILFGSNTFFKGYARHAHPYDFHTLRYTVAGAEKLREETQRTWMEKFGIRIYQGYGVTETSPVISVNTPMENKLGAVGRPVSKMEYYLEPVEGIEEGGRLFVKGPNVMLGYLLPDGDGEVQASASDRGPGWYDTGDIVKVDEDGYFYILGRAKRFAKIAGEMVSLTAVEELATQTWPGFSHAAVSLQDDKKGEKIILITDNKNALRKHFQDQLRKDKHGELYLPKKVLLAEELPVLGTGKTDYVTLTQMAQEAEDEGNSWIKKLATFVKQVGHHHENKTRGSSGVDTPSDTDNDDTTLLPTDELVEDEHITIRDDMNKKSEQETDENN
ncbi:MAG: acyl-[acyl-carrier-protein]-phospholipid O-acyltransferase [Gammaproteobacteria bacterium]|jgi:acyl-[acyl-carrier-protein]-phospholipid O-acyltransferase / long-chain-fatty-acid--[acyl-carrier-protein] ligase